MSLEAFLQGIINDPQNAATTWLVLADWLEDQGDPRSELVRLLHQPDYRRDWSGEQRDERVRELLASGMVPAIPSLIKSIGMKFVLIPAGTFLMGAPEGEGEENAHTQHQVEITQPFWMGTFPVTQAQWQQVM